MRGGARTLATRWVAASLALHAVAVVLLAQALRRPGVAAMRTRPVESRRVLLDAWSPASVRQLPAPPRVAPRPRAASRASAVPIEDAASPPAPTVTPAEPAGNRDADAPAPGRTGWEYLAPAGPSMLLDVGRPSLAERLPPRPDCSDLGELTCLTRRQRWRDDSAARHGLACGGAMGLLHRPRECDAPRLPRLPDSLARRDDSPGATRGES